MQEPLTGLFKSSRLMILNFADITSDTPSTQNIQQFFAGCEQRGINPRLPEYRQKFNNRMLETTNTRYLVSRYGEDRIAMLAGSQIAKEGRTLHMGLDIFCRDLETVFAPCDGTIVRTGEEPENHSYGYYLVFQPDHLPGIYFFFGHLSKEKVSLGPVKAGRPIAQLGDYIDHENGGWSRHLHLQAVRELPEPPATPNGYASVANFEQASQLCPNPLPYFPEWHIQEA